MAKRENYLIKLKMTSEQRELVKKAAGESGISINQFILSSTEEAAKKKINKIENKDIIESRIANTEKSLENLREKLDERKSKNKIFQDIVLRFK